MQKMFLRLALSFAFALVVVSAVSAQTFGCGTGVRYLQPTFQVGNPTTVTYGKNISVSGAIKHLKMDIYEPTGDVATKRPALVFAYGGSFVTGTRTDAEVVKVCQAYAARGYVAAAIDYRLLDLLTHFPPDSSDFFPVVIQAVGDMKAAVRWLRKDAATANTFRIDPDMIIVGGISAGSITALHTSYMKDNDVPPFLVPIVQAQGGIHGNTDDSTATAMGYSDAVQGDVNYFGALYRREFLDAGEPPVVSIHGDADPTVPYAFGYAHAFNLPLVTMEGSSLIHPRAIAEGVPSRFISVPGGLHGDFLSNPMWADSMMHSSFRFLYDNVICKVVSTYSEADAASVAIFPNPASDAVTVQFRNGGENYHLELFDLQGKIVTEQRGNTSNAATVRKDSLPTGVYMLRVTFDKRSTDTQQYLTQKVVFE